MTPAKYLTTSEIERELKVLDLKWDSLRKSLEEDGGMGGSPGEWIVERMWELEDELKKREG